MKTKRAVMLLTVLVIALAACGRNAPQAASPTPVTSAGFNTATPVPNATAAPQPQGSPTFSTQPAADNWDDRAIFRTGLIKAEQKTLDQLPDASVYHLDVQISDTLTSLQGQERVRYTNTANKPLDAIYFQLFPNMTGGKSTVSAVKVDGQEIKPVFESENSTVRVPLTTPLPPGQRVVVQMDFKVQVPTDAGGNYGVFGYLNNILVLDGFYPAIPVYDDKGWHAGKVPPNADSTFQAASFYVVRVTAPAALTLVASGIPVESAKQSGRQVVTFAAGPARDFYLAASERFVVLSETVGETKVNSYAFKDRAQGAQAALKTTVNAIKSFSARFGTYPYTEFDVVSTPMQGAYGIEYPGITGINYTLYDPKAMISGAPAPVILESTVAHEVGHQWFYNVVGDDQINEPWLDEAVVQYVTGLYFLDLYGQSGMESYRDSWLSRWDRVNREPLPIGLPAGSYQGKEYGAIVYGRGPLFIEALAKKVGQATFDTFLRDYVQLHKWGIGTTASFKQLADKHCQCDLTPLFNEWVYQKAAAAPSTSSGGGVIAFSSERDGNWDVYIMNVDGSDPRRLTSDGRRDAWPAWSPDGKSIVYHSVQSGVGVLNYLEVSTGLTHQVPLSLKGSLWEPAWSHDGQRIAFSNQITNGDGGIYVVHPDGEQLTRLTNATGFDGGPFWSPDDRQIAFYSNRDGNFEVYVMKADGTGQRRLTDNPAEDLVTGWSPDGTQLAFFSKRDGNYELYTINVDGTHLVRLTDTPTDEQYPAWSPDGKQLAFVSNRDGNYEIYVAPVPAQGTLISESSIRRLTNSPSRELMPVWMPRP